MLRRQARLRKEYLYRKSLEEQEQQKFERKQKLKEALRDGKRIDNQKELQAEADTYLYDEAQQAPTSHIDDEYGNAGVADPRILITTSRSPSSRLVQFAKEMRLVFPNAQRINRGNTVIKEVANACRANEVTDLIILHETRGTPDSMIISHFPYGPTLHVSLHNVVLRHDLPDQGTVPEVFPHLIFDKFTTKLGNRIQNILKHLFPVPKEESKRVMTFANNSDFISFRHHVFHKTSKTDVQIAEVGPRFEMRPYEIRLGTVDIPEADIEWVLRTYMRTTKKRDQL